jgi:hypothetical protein
VGCLFPIFPSLRLLSGQEVNNFQLSRSLSDSRAGPSALLTLKGFQNSSENELELGPKASDRSASPSPSSCAGSATSGSLPHEQLMHQAPEDLPQGVDPTRKEVGARPCDLKLC